VLESSRGGIDPTHDSGARAARTLRIERDLLAENDAYAAANRGWLARRGIFCVNLVSSPGSGKTTLLTRTIELLRDRLEIGVVEGDQQTSNDAQRIRATGAKAVQINTGKGCHLDAHMVGHALERLAPAQGSVVMIENVGNLVCPAAFDLGEAHKAVVLSVTEGEDKPLKYPDMFHAASVMLLNKIDLLPYVEFDVQRCIAYARQVNPDIAVIELSALRGAGMPDWVAWIEAGAQKTRAQLQSSWSQPPLPATSMLAMRRT
jgi:hydrogenase nickel incorporation protein HypB